MQRFDRVMGILLHLRSEQRVSAGDLARRFNVSRRTIYRDLDLLSALGVPVYAERGRGGGIRLMSGYFLPPVMLTTDEATSLILALTLLRSLRSRPFDAALSTTRQKVLAAVPDHLREIMANAERVIGFETVPTDTFHPERPLTDLPNDRAEPGGLAEDQVVTEFIRAVAERRMLRLSYRSPYRRSAASRDTFVEPAAVFWDRDHWYLVGRPFDGGGSTRVWRADRVIRLVQAGRGAGRDAVAFDVRELLDRVWLREAMQEWMRQSPVVVHISHAQYALLMNDWYYRHANYDQLPAGTVRMTFGEDNPDVALALVRWLGPDAELISPREWRHLLRAELERQAAMYT